MTQSSGAQPSSVRYCRNRGTLMLGHTSQVRKAGHTDRRGATAPNCSSDPSAPQGSTLIAREMAPS